MPSKMTRTEREASDAENAPPAEEAAAPASAPSAQKANNWRARLELRAPRSYNFFFKVALPVFCIIPFCIVCGYVLAKIEAPNEMSSNNANMADLVQKITDLTRLRNKTYELQHECYDAFVTPNNDTLVDPTELLQKYRAHINACDQEVIQKNAPIFDAFGTYFFESIQPSITFDWIRCGEKTARPAAVQFGNFANEWLGDFYRLWQEYAELYSEAGEGAKTLPEGVESIDLAIQDADGTSQCEVNVAGGSVFWWTVMTTVGYGNTSPSTSGGRTLVYTLGFLSILAFASILAEAGSIMLTICDDFFLRIKMKRLASGFLSMLFWLGMMALWFCAAAAIIMNFFRKHYPVNEAIEINYLSGYSTTYKEDPIPFSDGFWFSFITGTTIGLGDIHFRHDMLETSDMFSFPLMFLVSFVFLSNFAYKLTAFISPHLDVGYELSHILEKGRDTKSAANSRQDLPEGNDNDDDEEEGK